MIRLLAAAMVGTLFTAGWGVREAAAIPAFARKYQLGCNTCHTVFPQLTRFGRDFRDNGFRTPDQIESLLRQRSGTEPPAGSSEVSAEDFWSFIPDDVPLSVQGKLHGVIDPKGDVKTDIQVEELRLQSGGTFTPRVSYYLHHHLVEEGEPGELYTAWISFNNLLGSRWLNVTVGQIELPLSFSPEIERPSSFAYLAFDRTLGSNPFNLSRPQLGLQVFGQSEGGTKLWAGLANGFGLAVNEATETFDNNTFKDVYARVTQEIGEHYFGGFVYAGRAPVTATEGHTDDRFVRVGGDVFLYSTRAAVYGVVMYARDSNPLVTGEPRSFTGGFIELDGYLSDRAMASVRVDAVHEALPAAPEDEADGEEAVRVNTVAVTPGVFFLVRPNVKIGFEYQVRQARREDRGLAELHVAF